MEAVIEVNHEAIKANINQFRKIIDPKVRLLAVVKSNAYGHGMVEVAKDIEKKVDGFGVGYFKEAKELRDNKIQKNILVLGPSDRFQEAIEEKIDLTIESLFMAKKLMTFMDSLQESDQPYLGIHIKVNTGMNRFGMDENDLETFLEIYTKKRYKVLFSIKGLFSHLATTELQNSKNILRQEKKFESYQVIFEKYIDKSSDISYHLANSEATVDCPSLHYDMVRIGNGLFGPIATRKKLDLTKVATIKAPIVSIHTYSSKQNIGYGLKNTIRKNHRVGIVEIGSYEGIGLEKSPIGQDYRHQIYFFIKRCIKSLLRPEMVRCKASRLPIIGSVNMQYIQIDLMEEDVEIGDYVILYKAPIYIKEAVKREHCGGATWNL